MALQNRLARRRPIPTGPGSVTEDDLWLGQVGEQFPAEDIEGLVLCDVLPIWHVPGRCPTTFLCPTPVTQENQ
jgi:hypothetical protein